MHWTTWVLIGIAAAVFWKATAVLLVAWAVIAVALAAGKVRHDERGRARND